MDISPGTELVWNLAAQEAMAARMESIEPEHFLCAILKFAELTDEELGSVAARADVVSALSSERSRVQAFLQVGDFPTTRLRRALRRAMGRGQFRHDGGVVHRSEASRSLFEHAVASARRQGAALASRHLLRALLESPSPTTQKVMEDLGLMSASAKPPDATPLLSRYARRLDPSSRDAGSPTADAPQIEVVAAALQREAAAFLMLVCEPGATLSRIVAGVAGELSEQTYLYELDHNRVLQQSGDVERCQAEIADLWAETAETENLAMFVDATGEETRSVSLLLTALAPALEAGKPGLVVAVSEDVYHSRVRPDPALGSAFRIIWLHDLSDQEVPGEI